jgi:hypothetical protein
MNVKEYKAVDLKKKNGAYLSIKITREMNAYEVALPYVGHVTKVISMVARKGLSYGNLAEVKSRPIGSNEVSARRIGFRISRTNSRTRKTG